MRKLFFLILCRKRNIANKAPTDPPKNTLNSKLFSDIRYLDLFCLSESALS